MGSAKRKDDTEQMKNPMRDKEERQTGKNQSPAKLHKFTQNYPTERKDYYKPVQGNPMDRGRISPEDAERIQSDDLPEAA
jgi:hypothetical protein